MPNKKDLRDRTSKRQSAPVVELIKDTETTVPGTYKLPPLGSKNHNKVQTSLTYDKYVDDAMKHLKEIGIYGSKSDSINKCLRRYLLGSEEISELANSDPKLNEILKNIVKTQ